MSRLVRDPRTPVSTRLRSTALAFLVALLAVGLSSCDLFRRTLGVPDDCRRRDVVFATSDAIVRGIWTGTLEGWPAAGASSALTLDLDATYVDTNGYLLDGTFEVEGEPDRALTGTVSGGCAERYLAGDADATAVSTLSVPPPASLVAVVEDGGQEVWRLEAAWGTVAGEGPDGGALDARVLRVDGTGSGFDEIVVLTRTPRPCRGAPGGQRPPVLRRTPFDVDDDPSRQYDR